MVGDACALVPHLLACLVTPTVGINLTPRRINVTMYHLVRLLGGFGRYLVQIVGSKVAKLLFQCVQLTADCMPDLQDLIFSQ